MPADYTLFCGRFQPFHNGHFDVVKRMISGEFGGAPILGVIINSTAAGAEKVSSETLALGDKRQSRSLNPFTLMERLSLIRNVLTDEVIQEELVLTAIPRPELYWELIESMFPGNRQWILATGKDEFEKAKERFFISRGDKVVLLERLELGVSGTMLRSLWLGGSEFEQLVPRAVGVFLKERLEECDL